MAPLSVTRIGEGEYRVEKEGRTAIVYVAADGPNRWAFWNGTVYYGSFTSKDADAAQPAAARRPDPHSLMAPMPATVVRVLARPGDSVKKGETLVLLEAMKMELPVRAPDDGVVAAVRCREGELVQPDTVLVELR